MRKKLKEDVTLIALNKPDYKKGGPEYRQKLLDYFNQHSDVFSDVYISEDIYPSRRDCIWYANTSDIWRCTYKGCLRVSAYCYGDDCCVHLDDDDDRLDCHNAQELEAQDIYTDEELRERIDHLADPWDADYSFFSVWVDPINSSVDGASLYDLGYEEVFNLNELVSDNLGWIFGLYGVVDTYIQEYLLDDSDSSREWAYAHNLAPRPEPVNEDVKLTPVDTQDYGRGSDEYMAEIKQWFDSHSDIITSYEFLQTLYPLRTDPIWYYGYLIKFMYKNAIEVVISCYPDGQVYFSDDEDSDYASNAEELEEHGIYTDEELYDTVVSVEDPWQDFTGEFYVTCSCVEDAPCGRNPMELYELNYDPVYSLDELFPLDWVAVGPDSVVDSYIDECVCDDSDDARRWVVEKGLRTPEEIRRLGWVYPEEPTNENIDEDVTITHPEIPDWKRGHDEAVSKLKQVLDSYLDDEITDYAINEYVIYPLRDRAEWYSQDWIIEFVYKGMLHFSFYCGGDVCIPIDDGDEYMYDFHDFEQNGIYTDDELYEHIRWLEDEYGNYCDDNMPYINFTMELTDEYNNSHNKEELGNIRWGGYVYGYDLNYEDVYRVSDVTEARYLRSFIEDEIPDIVSMYDFKSNEELEREASQDDDSEEETDIEEDIIATPIDIPEYDRQYLNKHHSKESSIEAINAGFAEPIWEVCAWVKYLAAYAFHWGPGTFEEAYSKFLETKDKDVYKVIELRRIPSASDDYVTFTVLCVEKSSSVNEANENKPTYQQVLNDLIKTFGFIDVDAFKNSDATYILPNGKLLDTKGPFENSQHENIAKYIEKKYNIKDMDKESGSKFMNHIGAIRITPWILGIVAPSKKMTSAQEDTLFSIIKILSPFVNPDHPLMITSEDGSQFIEYSKIDNPEEVVTAILGYQILGILKEHLTSGKEMKFLNKLNK